MFKLYIGDKSGIMEGDGQSRSRECSNRLEYLMNLRKTSVVSKKMKMGPRMKLKRGRCPII